MLPRFLLVLIGLIAGSGAVAQDYEFHDVTSEAGVADGSHDHFGACWADYDADGLLDLYVVNAHQNTLYRNTGEGIFEDVTAATGTGDPWEAMRNVFADYDQDGDLDFYSHNFIQSTLYQNNDNVFTDVNLESGAGIAMPKGTGAGWADYDNDGWLDLHLTGFPGWNVLLHNQGDGTFLDQREAASMPLDCSAMGNAWGDFDNDGDPDLALATVTRDDVVYFYENGGEGAFTDVSTEVGILAATEAGSSGAGVTWGDYDNDGFLDLVLTEVRLGSEKQLPLRVYLFHNNGDTTFTDVTLAAGIATPAASGYWDASFADYDNDGFLDLFISSDKAANHLFRNDGDGTFTDVAAEAGVELLSYKSVGGVWGDYDTDGDLDLYVVNQDQEAGQVANVLYENSGGSRHWLQVVLEGTVSNADAIGARIVARFDGGRIALRDVSGGTGFFSQHTPVQQFGLNRRASVNELEIRWPSGSIQKFKDVAADQRLTLVEPPVMFAVNDEEIASGETLSFASEFGIPGAPVMIALTGLGGAPWFQPLFRGNYDADGSFGVDVAIGGGLSGLEMTFLAVTENEAGRAVASNVRTVTFL